ncbi:MAG: component of SufBCD complex [Pseudomonadota bacterium]
MDFAPSQVWASADLRAMWASQGRTEEEVTGLDWTDTILRVIELRTFSSIWYWLVVIVAWAMASHWLIGVPFDMLFRARKANSPAIEDLEGMVDLQVRRITMLDDMVGPLAIALGAFVVSGLGMMGFVYGFEMAQGAFVLLAPLSIVGLVNLRLAQRLRRTPLQGRDLVRHLFRMRLFTQVIGAISLFFTAMYGMYFNIAQMNFF